jgi:acetyltransferase-like isoleucine patch superfamily enzyme
MIGALDRALRVLAGIYYRWRVVRAAGGVRGRLKVNGRSRVNANTFLGDNVHFNGLTVLGGGGVTIGDNFHSGRACVFITEFHDYQGEALPYDRNKLLRPVVVGDNVWLGHGVIVLGGVSIGEGAIIQAGAVVVSDIPALGIAGGNPARVFKERDSGHYWRLKEQGRFH